MYIYEKNLDENTEWHSGGTDQHCECITKTSLIRAAAVAIHMLHLIISVLLAGRHPQYLLDVTPSFQHALSVTAQWPGRQVDGQLCLFFFKEKLIRKSFTYILHYKEFRGISMFANMCDLLMAFTCYADVYLSTSIGYMLRLQYSSSHPQQNKKCP